jgi:periplasmic protein TonB
MASNAGKRDFGGWITPRTQMLEVAIWLGASLVTCGGHATAVAWMLRGEPVVAADNSPPAAIMIELAAAPEAVAAERNEITADRKSTDESAPQQEQKSEQRPQQQTSEPAAERNEPAQKEDSKLDAAVQDKAEFQRPVEQPKPKKETRPEKPNETKPHPRKQQATADSKAAQQAQVQARQSERTAAAQTASGLSSMSPANWQSLLMAHLERRKRYLSGERGSRAIAYVRFAIDGAGKVLSANLVQSSGFAELDQEAVALVHRSSPVPAPPPGANRAVTVPVRFGAR